MIFFISILCFSPSFWIHDIHDTYTIHRTFRAIFLNMVGSLFAFFLYIHSAASLIVMIVLFQSSTYKWHNATLINLPKFVYLIRCYSLVLFSAFYLLFSFVSVNEFCRDILFSKMGQNEWGKEKKLKWLKLIERCWHLQQMGFCSLLLSVDIIWLDDAFSINGLWIPRPQSYFIQTKLLSNKITRASTLMSSTQYNTACVGILLCLWSSRSIYVLNKFKLKITRCSFV